MFGYGMNENIIGNSMMKCNESISGHIACFAAYAIFGFNIVVCKDLAGSNLISPIALFCLRSSGAGILFWFISLFLKRERVERFDYVRIFAASVLGFFLTQITFLTAISSITPMDCSIISSMSPICTMLIAAVVLKEPVTLMKFSGVMLSFFGIVYLILNSSTSSGGVAETSLTGILLMVANCVCFSLYLGMFKPVILKYSVVTFMKWVFLFSFLLSLPFSGKELLSIDYFSLPSSIISEIAFLVICATFMTYFLIPFGQKYIRPTLVSLYSYVQPVVAIAISICVGMDVLSLSKIVAAIVVFAGVAIVSFSKKAKV